MAGAHICPTWRPISPQEPCACTKGRIAGVMARYLIIQVHDGWHARTHLAHLLLAAPPAALRGLGQSRKAAPAPDPRRPRPLPQLGLDGGGPAGRLARHRPRPARPWRQPVVARRQLHDGRLHLRSRPAHPPAAAGPGDRSWPTPWAATSPCATPASIRRRWRAWRPSRGWARRPARWPSGRARTIVDRMDEWIREQRSLAGRLPRRYASIEDAFRRMQEENPHLSAEQARHLTDPRGQPERGRDL